MVAQRITAERWQDIAYWPLLTASIAFVFAYSWQVIADPPFPRRGWTVAILLVTWIIFVIDYLARWWLAAHRAKWFRAHIVDLLVVLLPALRPLRLMRTIGVAQHRGASKGDQLRGRIAFYGALAAAIIVWFAALAELEAERDAPGATIVNIGDAIWWAFVTITTVGYGDYSPVTIVGRVVAVCLMLGGIAILGVTTATVSSWIIERASGRGEDVGPATRGQVRALGAKVDELSQRLSDPDSGSSTG